MHARLLRREPDWPVLRIRPLGARRFVDSDSRPMRVPTIALPVTVMVSPSLGTVTGPGMAYLPCSFHDPGVLPPGTGDNH